jgi:hypothetical protein
MSGAHSDKSQETTGDLYCQSIVNEILTKLRDDPHSLTTEDARRLSENAVAGDMRTAKIISAVEAFAVASEVIHDVDPRLDQAPHTSLHTLINDLKIAVEQNPTDVTAEVLRTAQNVVSSRSITFRYTPCDVTCTNYYKEMQRAIGNTNAPYPELEAELQEEIAKIEPKVAEGTVTIEEANHLHSLEARAHGHTEKGRITSIAQSVAAKRERQLSSSGSSPISNRSRANSKAFTPQEQSHRDKEPSLHAVPDAIKREGSLSDQTNVPSKVSTDESKLPKGQSQRDPDVGLKLAEMSLEPKLEKEPEKTRQEDAAHIQPSEHGVHG